MNSLMKRYFVVWPLLLCCRQATAPDNLFSAEPGGTNSRPAEITPADVRPHIEYLASRALQGRGARPGKLLAAEYIRNKFEQIGLRPLFFGGGFYQSIPGPRVKSGEMEELGRNVGGWLPGSDLQQEFIILSAHYDHLGAEGNIYYPGADDNASSVAMLLEVARQFAAGKPPRRSLAFVSFDLEERLLWGSRWFVAHPPWPLPQVKLFITADLIGRSLGNLPLSTIFVMGSEQALGLKDLIERTPAPPGLHVARLGVDLVGTRSDYGPFRSEKIPFLFFSSGEHPDYHTPDDTAERIDFPQVARVSNLIRQVCAQAADADSTPRWTDAPEHEIDEVRTIHHITELLLARDDADKAARRPGLSNLQRFTVSNIKTQLGRTLERGTITAADRPSLVRSAQLLLLTAF